MGSGQQVVSILSDHLPTLLIASSQDISRALRSGWRYGIWELTKRVTWKLVHREKSKDRRIIVRDMKTRNVSDSYLHSFSLNKSKILNYVTKQTEILHRFPQKLKLAVHVSFRHFVYHSQYPFFSVLHCLKTFLLLQAITDLQNIFHIIIPGIAENISLVSPLIQTSFPNKKRYVHTDLLALVSALFHLFKADR